MRRPAILAVAHDIGAAWRQAALFPGEKRRNEETKKRRNEETENRRNGPGKSPKK
ncbi:hypothetical protein [Herbaspirillum seropedicae]|uniref:hypothetical protein n=1 Tax=Herbaspirillum seropedicae TaxID=964 RepID=UPI002861AB4C|nr:hypothetical protein [Herbaspirillum seropedicae]MDR6396203.1 hypothetical protein [Herbaspirillum seropedicae]